MLGIISKPLPCLSVKYNLLRVWQTVKLVQGDKEIPAQETRFVNSDQVDCIFRLPQITQTEIWDVVVTGSYTQVDTLDGRFKIVSPLSIPSPITKS
jgi:hypothetical protein